MKCETEGCGGYYRVTNGKCFTCRLIDADNNDATQAEYDRISAQHEKANRPSQLDRIEAMLTQVLQSQQSLQERADRLLEEE